MASSTGGAGSADEIRYRSYLTQLERQQDADVKDREDQHRDRVAKLVSANETQTSQMRKDYDVKISDEAEALEHKLGLIRDRNKILIDQERDRGDKEAEKIRTQYQQKIDDEKKVGDEQLNRLQSYYRKAAQELDRQYRKEQAREQANAAQRKGKSYE